MKIHNVFYVFFVGFFLAIFFFPFQVVAAGKTQLWYCLKIPVDANGNGISCGDAAAGCSRNRGAGHRVKINTKNDALPPPNKDMYIIGCIGGANGTTQVCTTGFSGSDLDLDIFEKDNLADLKIRYGYQFQGLFNGPSWDTPLTPPSTDSNARATPVRINGSGQIETLEWQDYTPKGHDRKFIGLVLVDPSHAADATGGGVKEGELNFDAAEESCVSIAWDPEGRLFDYQTLEPLTNTHVFLKYNTKYPTAAASDADFQIFSTWMGKTFDNYYTKEMGDFSFVVPDGDYKILIDAPLAIASVSATHPGYAKAYTNIYEPNSVIEQRGSIQHRDVAVKTATPTRSDVKVWDVFIEGGNGDMIISGKTSHPLTQITVNSSKVYPANAAAGTAERRVPYRVIATGQSTADAQNFKIVVQQSKLERTAEYTELPTDVIATKVDLTATTPEALRPKTIWDKLVVFVGSLIKPIFAQSTTTSFHIEPMPTYLEGYAYDSSGKVIPNALVGVYLTFSNVPSYEVQAGADGYFKITSEHIPSMAYDIRFKLPGGSIVKTSTSTFISQNQKTNTEKAINPFVYKDAKNNTLPTPTTLSSGQTDLIKTATKVGSKTGTSTNAQAKSPTSTKTKATQNVFASQNPAVTQTIVILLLLVLLLGGVGVGLFLYMKNKNQQPGMY